MKSKPEVTANDRSAFQSEFMPARGKEGYSKGTFVRQEKVAGKSPMYDADNNPVPDPETGGQKMRHWHITNLVFEVQGVTRSNAFKPLAAATNGGLRSETSTLRAALTGMGFDFSPYDGISDDMPLDEFGIPIISLDEDGIPELMEAELTEDEALIDAVMDFLAAQVGKTFLFKVEVVKGFLRINPETIKPAKVPPKTV